MFVEKFNLLLSWQKILDLDCEIIIEWSIIYMIYIIHNFEKFDVILY